MKHQVNVKWKKNMAFEADVNGHKLMMDADEKVGGKDQGPRPKPLLLVALGGCSGMDVTSILAKMRVEPEDFQMDIEAGLTEAHPKVYQDIHLIYTFKGKDLPMEKLEKAVNLSLERYCGVTAMLEQGARITHEIKVID